MHMVTGSHAEIVFTRLPQVDAADLIALMNDARVRRHLPLARGVFGPAECEQFVEIKERVWAEHGYGPWAFVIRGELAGWGGLQPEGEDIDLGLVLRPKFWGWGPALYARLAAAAFEELHAASITILLPTSRVHISGVLRLGFRLDGEIDVAGERFFRYRQTATKLGASSCDGASSLQ